MSILHIYGAIFLRIDLIFHSIIFTARSNHLLQWDGWVKNKQDITCWSYAWFLKQAYIFLFYKQYSPTKLSNYVM